MQRIGINGVIFCESVHVAQVTFNSYASRNEATNNLYRIQKTVSKDAWLLVEKLD